MNCQERMLALERARQGDVEALGELLHSFEPYVRVIVRALQDRRVQARVDDSDFIQDALLEAHRSFSGFRGTSVAELVVWLRQIVVRTTGRTLRSLVGTAKRDPALEEPDEPLERLAADSDSSPSASAIRHEEAMSMAEALSRLPEEMQQILLDRHVDGLSHGEIARRLERSEGAVRMLYLRALRRLREVYRG
jgi:RNA polymerase sigma-70 factor (ECF subfamily)